MENLVEIKNEQQFDEELKNNKLVLVDFHGTWCNPCKMITPIIEDISKIYNEKIRVCKIDVDENNELTSRYGVRSIPMLMVFENGEVVKKQAGAIPKSRIIELFNDLI